MSDSKKNTPSKSSPAKAGTTPTKEDKAKADAEAKEKSGATQVVDLGFLEADDDFEEFPTEEWKEKLPGDTEDEKQVNIWEDNWDDDNIEEDFSKQLKAELEKRKLTPNAATAPIR